MCSLLNTLHSIHILHTNLEYCQNVQSAKQSIYGISYTLIEYTIIITNDFYWNSNIWKSQLYINVVQIHFIFYTLYQWNNKYCWNFKECNCWKSCLKEVCVLWAYNYIKFTTSTAFNKHPVHYISILLQFAVY